MKKFKKVFKILIVFLILLSQLFPTVYNTFYVNDVSAVGNNGDLVLTVLSHEDKKGIAEATFDLKNSANQVVNQLVTDSNGRAVVLGLKPGNYKLVQKTTGVGYMLPKKNEYAVEIQSSVTTYRTITNNKRRPSEPIPIDSEARDSTTLRLKVVDGNDRNQGVSGAKFLLKGDTVLKEITTGSGGTINVEGLTYGTYSLTQISAPDGYLPIDKETTFEIPKPNLVPAGIKYAEFKDVQIDNLPYDKSKYGVLNVNVFDNDNRSIRVPNVTLKLTDTYKNRVYLGTTDSNGNVQFKGISPGPQRKFKIEAVKTPYDYEGSGFKFEETFNVPLIGGRNQEIYLPKKPLRHLTINNYEKGSFSTKIGGGTFKLYHEDGTSEVITIGPDGIFNKEIPHGNYILEQLTSDGAHIVNSARIPFRLAREVELNIENELLDPASKKVSMTFNKVWVDKPSRERTSTVYLYANGEKTNKFIEISSNDEAEKTFSDLPKFDANHNTITYSLKEEAVEGYYAVYEQKPDGKWTIKNYSGTQHGICAPPIVWMSTANNAFSFRMENGIFAKQEVNFPNDAQYGQSLAYQKEGTLLFAAGIEGGEDSDNKNAKLVVYDVSKGENGKLVKNVSLGDLGLGSKGYSFVSNNFAHQNSKNFHWRHNKVNTMGISSDQKYILVKHNVVPEIHFFRISDILNTQNGGTVKPAKIVDASFPVTKTGYRPLADGDIVQYPNGDILFTGHQFIGNGTTTTRERYRFYLLKYNGDTNDIAKGSYGSAKNVGQLPHIRKDATVTYNWQGGSPETQSNIEGLAIVSPSPGKYKLYAATNNGSIKITGVTGTNWSGSVHKGWAEVTRNDNGESAMPGWQGIGGEDFAFKLKPVSVGTDVDTKLNSATGGRPALITDMTAAEGDNCFITTSVRGAKIWQGDDESTRPNSITVRLFADGVDTGKTQVVTKANNWAYEFTDLDKYKLDAGSNDTGTAIVYTVKEDNVPKGYSQKQEEGTYNIVNTYEKGSFQFRKTNKEKNTNLPGATFTLYNEDKSKIVATSISDVNGIVKFDNLTEGTYKLEETVAPNGYELSRQEYTVKARIDQNTNKLEFTLLNNDTPVEKDSTNHIITNDKEKSAKLIIRKNDDAGSPLNGATFRMTNLSDNTTVEKTTEASGEIVFDNLKIGKYKLEETRVPIGFKEPTSTYEVTVTSDLRVLVNTIEKNNNIAAVNGFRSALNSEDNLVTNRRSDIIDKLLFRNATNSNLVTTIPEPYYRNNSPDGISSNNITTKQNISATSTKGRYRVDVEVNAVNRDLDVVFVVQGARYENVVANNREIIKSAFEEIKKIADKNGIKANVTVYEDGSPTSNNYKDILVNYMDVNEAIRTQAYNNVKASLNPDNYRGIRNSVETILNAAKENKDRPVRNKLLIQILERGLWSDEKNNVSGNSVRLSAETSAFKHYIVWGNASSRDGSYWDPAQVYPNNPRGDKVDRTNTAAYSQKVNDFIKNNVLDLKTGNISINLNNNVRFDGFENVPSDTTAQNSGQSITVTGIKHTGHQPYRFSYYVRSNSETANLNTFEDINSTAVYKPLSEISSDPGLNIPIPKVAVPGIQFRVNKTYTDSVAPEMRKSTSINLLKNGIAVESLTLNEGIEKFKTVQPAFDNDGNSIEYSIREEGIDSKLISNIEPSSIRDRNGTFNVVTDLASLNLKVTKEWVTDNQKEVRVKLIAKVGDREIDIRNLGYNGELEKNITANTGEGESWTTVFKNIPRKNNNGEVITYEVREISVGNNTNPSNDYKIEYFINEDSVKVVNTEHTKLFVTNYRNTLFKFKVRKIGKGNDTPIGNQDNNRAARILVLDANKQAIAGEVANLTTGEQIYQRGGAKYEPGIYYLKEERAPEGYVRLTKLIKIEITNTGEVNFLGYENEDRNDHTLTNADNMVTVSKDTNDPELITINIKNKKLFNLHIKKRVKSEVNALGTITSSDQLDGNLVRLRAVFNLEKENGTDNWENVRQDIATENGYASLQNLEEGKYRLVETTAPNGYYRLNDPIEFTVDSSGITVNRNSENAVAFKHNNSTTELVVAVKNEPLKYKFKVRKIGKGNDTPIGNPDHTRAARILVLDSNKQAIAGQVANLTTGEQLYDKAGAKYEPGIYYLKEERAPEGYDRLTKLIKIEITNTGEVNFLGYENEDRNDHTLTNADNMVTVSKDTNDPELITINISNTKIFNMTFQKIDATKKGEFNANNNNLDKSLAGAKIKIRPKVNDGNSKIVFDDDVWNRDNMNGEYSQTDGGVVWVSKNNDIPGFRLTEGTYIAEEIEAPNGFEKFSPFEIVVSSTGNVTIQSNNNPQGNISVGAVNGRVIIHAVDPTSMYDIKLLKVDKENSETTLANSRFKISKDSAGNTEAEEKDIANVVIPMLPDGSVNNNGENYWDDSFNTDRHHNYSGYGVGLYYLTETQAPNGYKGLEESVPFYINSNGTVTIPAKLQDGTVVFVNGVAEKDTASKYADFFEVEVRNDYKWAPKKLIVIKAKNEKNDISIKLKKVLENNENTTIDGVKFKLFSKHQTENKPDENKPYGDPNGYTTADGGIITIPNISQGEYFLKETEVPSVNDRNRPTAEYKLNEKYYKIIVAQDGTVTFGDKALVKGQNDVYTEVDVDDKLVLGTKENNIQNVTFKNEVRYRVSLEKDFYFTNFKPRVGGQMKFYIKPNDENSEKIEVVNISSIGQGFTILNEKSVEGVNIARNGILWRFDRNGTTNPIFSLIPGTYTVEEFNLLNNFEKVKFEFTVAEDGRVGIVGFENQTSNPAVSNYGFADGNIFWIRQNGTPGTNSSTIHIHNKTPMEMYLKKVDQKGTRINVGKLKLKLEGANVFDKDGQKTDEITLDLARDYVEGKGLKIVIPKEIKTGTYILTEEEAPVGYQKTNKRYHIKIDQFMRTIKLIKTDDGVGNDGVVKNEVLTRPEKVLYREEFNGRNTRDFLTRFTNTEDIVNKKSEYPYTGGMGGLGYILLGTALMSVSVISIRKRYR